VATVQERSEAPVAPERVKPSSGMRAKTSGARIAGVVSCVPPRIVDNKMFEERFGSGADEVTKMTGVKQRHYAEDGVATSDLCEKAAEHLLDKLGWERDSVDGVIFVSQSPDLLLPATACIVQGRMGLKTGIIGYDISLGCSGYPYGMWQAMMAVQTGAAKRMLLMVGDISTRCIDPNDRATAMLFGDAGTVTAIEAGDDSDIAYFMMGSDGRGAENLMIPRSRQRSPKAEGRLEGRDLDALYMDGGEIFNFTLKSVPPLIRNTLEWAGETIESYDSFLLHQANTFMINHIAKKAKLPKEKVPINMDRFGNTSSATIPLLMTTDVRDQLTSQRCKLGMFGFGVGYSWASASLDVGPLACVDHIIR
jgi:3-oxoacyl-[acyl-carrier-protein] synthase-3